VTLVKHEWHRVDSQFTYELGLDKLSEIYPLLDEHQLKEMLTQLALGTVSVERILTEAYDNDIEIEWQRNYDDWVTERKGGYETTYQLK
jgi:hypothetical protein